MNADRILLEYIVLDVGTECKLKLHNGKTKRSRKSSNSGHIQRGGEFYHSGISSNTWRQPPLLTVGAGSTDGRDGPLATRYRRGGDCPENQRRVREHGEHSRWGTNSVNDFGALLIMFERGGAKASTAAGGMGSSKATGRSGEDGFCGARRSTAQER